MRIKLLLERRPLNMTDANRHPKFTLTSGHRPSKRKLGKLIDHLR